MATPIDGFRRHIGNQLPELIAECEAKVAAAEQLLNEQLEALAYVRAIAAQHLAMSPAPKIETGAEVVASDTRASSEPDTIRAPALHVA